MYSDQAHVFGSTKQKLVSLFLITLLSQALTGCNENFFSQGSSKQASLSGGGGDSDALPPGLPALDDPNDTDDDHDQDQDDDDWADNDDWDMYRYVDRRKVYFKRIQTAGVDYTKSLTLNSVGDTCTRSITIVHKNKTYNRSRSIKLDNCSGFINARALAAQNGGSCVAKRKVIRQLSIGNVMDLRVLSIDASCLCAYHRELVVGGALSMRKSRFARPESCASEL